MSALLVFRCEMGERAAILFNHRFYRCHNLPVVA